MQVKMLLTNGVMLSSEVDRTDFDRMIKAFAGDNFEHFDGKSGRMLVNRDQIAYLQIVKDGDNNGNA